MSERPQIGYVPEAASDTGLDRTPPAPGRQAAVLGALVIGGLLLALQLWFLTVALDLYLEGDQDWLLAVFSGIVFVGGLFVLRLLSRRAEIHR